MGSKVSYIGFLIAFILSGPVQAAQQTDRLDLRNGTTDVGKLRLYEDGDDGTNYAEILPQAMSSTIQFLLPNTASGTIYASGNTDVALADGGTGASLADPNANKVIGWDDTDGAVKFWTLGSGLSYNDVTDTISATGTGYITSVGDCTTGACLDGSSDGGTSISLYDGDSHKGTFQTANLNGDRVYTFGNLSLTFDQSVAVGAGPAFTNAVLTTPNIGTPSAGTLTNATGLPVAGITSSTSTALGVGSLEVGHASDTTLARASAGNLTVEGNALYMAGGTDVPVTDGGTGRSTSTTAYGLIAAGTTATGAHQTLAAGATTEILVGGGASALPVWTTAQGSGAPVRATSPTLTTPNIGVATATSVNGMIPVSPGTAPSITSVGHFSIDTTDDQFVYYGGAKRVLAYERTVCAVLESLTASDDNYAFFMNNDAVTVTAVGCNCRGTCSTLATFTLEDRGGNAMTITGTNPTCATTGAATFAAVTAGNQLVAGEMLAFDVTNTPTTGDTYALCVQYTADAQ